MGANRIALFIYSNIPISCFCKKLKTHFILKLGKNFQASNSLVVLFYEKLSSIRGQGKGVSFESLRQSK